MYSSIIHEGNGLPSSYQPNLHCLIQARGGDFRTVGRPLHIIHAISMSSVEQQLLPSRGVPHLNQRIITRSKICAIRRPCQSNDRRHSAAAMTKYLEITSSSCFIPQLYTIIRGCQSDTITIWRPCE